MAVWEYFYLKDWSPYPFIAPFFSLFVTVYLIPTYDKLFQYLLESYLIAKSIGDKYVIVNGIAQDRGLQVAYIMSISSFVISSIAALRSNHPVWLSIVLFIMLCVGIPLFLEIFLREPGFHATTKLQGNGIIKKYLVRWECTYLQLYSRILAILNLLLIVIIIIALPDTGGGSVPVQAGSIPVPFSGLAFTVDMCEEAPGALGVKIGGRVADNRLIGQEVFVSYGRANLSVVTVEADRTYEGITTDQRFSHMKGKKITVEIPPIDGSRPWVYTCEVQ